MPPYYSYPPPYGQSPRRKKNMTLIIIGVLIIIGLCYAFFKQNYRYSQDVLNELNSLDIELPDDIQKRINKIPAEISTTYYKEQGMQSGKYVITYIPRDVYQQAKAVPGKLAPEVINSKGMTLILEKFDTVYIYLPKNNE